MSTLLFTLGIAFVIVLIAVGLLAISWLLTGKSTLKPGACGRDPTHKQDPKEGCGTTVSCQLCKKPDEKKQ